MRGTIPAWPAGCSPSAEYAGKCNAPGCTKVTKCHLPKATRCAPLQASSRRPVYNYMFLFSFLYSRPSFSPPSLSRDHRSRTYVRTYVCKSRRTSYAWLSDGSATYIYMEFSDITYKRASESAGRGHVNIAAGPAREFRRKGNRSGTEQRNGIREIVISDRLRRDRDP